MDKTAITRARFAPGLGWVADGHKKPLRRVAGMLLLWKFFFKEIEDIDSTLIVETGLRILDLCKGI